MRRPISVDTMFKKFKSTYPNLGKTAKYYHHEQGLSIRLYFEDGSMMIYDFEKNRITSGVIEPEPYYIEEGCEYEVVDNRTEKEMTERFGVNLRWEMRRSKLTQKELSELADIPIRTLGRYVRGERMPNMYVMNRIAQALKCPMNHLYRM